MNSTTTIRCLMNTTLKPNVQNGPARCDKILNQYITKSGEYIKEVICDYGNGLCTKSEVFSNKIINTASNGKVVEYSKNHVGDVLIKEGDNTVISRNPNLWNNLLATIYKGF